MNKFIKTNKILKVMLAVFFYTAIFITPVFAAKYTIAKGQDFNARIKLNINSTFTSATPDYTIRGFEMSSNLEGTPIDISEDGDSSVLAYIKNNVIYCVCEEEAFLNEDSSYMFDKFINLQYVKLPELNFSKVKKTNFMFGNCKYLTNIDMDNDSIISLHEMQGMFYDCQSLVDANIYMLNTKMVKSMNSLFYNCKNLKNINICPSEFSVINNIDFGNMYKNCYMLKTNFGRAATEIDESLYKSFSIAGDDDKEGLLKDVDYEYDDYGKNSGSYKIDSITETLVTSAYNTNSTSNVSSNFMQNAKSLSIANIATDSVYYDNKANVVYKNGKMKFTDNLLSQTVDEIPILADETTKVDVLIPKRKDIGLATISLTKDIVPEENSYDKVKNTVSTDSNIKGLLRPSYDNFNIEESNESIDNESEKLKNEDMKIYNQNTFQLILIFISAILIVLVGIIIYNVKNKKNTDF